MQTISNDKTKRNETMLDLKDLNNQSYNTNQKSEQFVSTMPAVKKDFSLLGDDIIDIFAENAALKDKIGSHEQH